MLKILSTQYMNGPFGVSELRINFIFYTFFFEVDFSIYSITWSCGGRSCRSKKLVHFERFLINILDTSNTAC